MKKTVYVCDRCGKEVGECDLDNRFIPYDFQPYGLISKPLDLCHSCQAKWAEFGKCFLKECEKK